MRRVTRVLTLGIMAAMLFAGLFSARQLAPAGGCEGLQCSNGSDCGGNCFCNNPTGDLAAGMCIGNE